MLSWMKSFRAWIPTCAATVLLAGTVVAEQSDSATLRFRAPQDDQPAATTHSGLVIPASATWQEPEPATPEAPEVDAPEVDAVVETIEEAIECDCEKLAALKKAAAKSHKPLFYENNFDYLCDPCYTGELLGDRAKRMCVGDCSSLDIGGQYRARYHHEHNFRGLGLTGVTDDFLLHRTRLYANLQVGHRFRAYAEMIDAESNYETFGPRPIEQNRTELLNAFGDGLLLETTRGDVWARVGRQELLYGAQRLVSPLDWANTRRTFEGYKVMWEGCNWDIDWFWVRPVPQVDGVFDTPDQSQEFTGLYFKNKAVAGRTLDLYYLRYLETAGAGFTFDTLGMRLGRDLGVWHWEAEGDVQVGEFQNNAHAAGAWTVGIGRDMPCVTWTPSIWAYFDWASGDPIAGNGYHHNFPLAHKYLGFMDLYGRRNIEDFNILLTAKPHDKLKLVMWWHVFNLQDINDGVYNVVMGQSAPAGTSEDLGQELDLLAQWTFGPRSNIVFGYSHFWAGNFYKNHPNNIPSDDADFFYTQFTVNF